MIECPKCGATADDSELKCRYCSEPLTAPGETASAELPEEPFKDVLFTGAAPEAPNPPPLDPPPAQPQQQAQQQQAQYQAPPQQGYQQQQYQQQPNYQQQGQPYYQNQPGYQNQQQYAPGGQPGQPYGQPPYYTPPINVNVTNANYNPGYDPRYRDINKLVAGILAIVLGVFGVHKFYMGKIGVGIVCCIFFWTGIPAIVGIIEGIVYLCMDDVAFREKYARKW